MVTRVFRTVILVVFTQHPDSAVRAGAAEAGYQVVAGASIGAGLGCTLVNVQLTVLALEASQAVTLILPRQVATSGTVFTGC